MKNGSRSEEAEIIAFGVFAKGVKILSDIYLQALRILSNRRKTNLSRATIDMISNVLINERGNYFNRLRRIYNLENVSDHHVVIKAEKTATTYPLRIVFDQETLSYHYQFTRILIRILHLSPDDFTLPPDTDILSDKVIADLFFTDIPYSSNGPSDDRNNVIDPFQELLRQYDPSVRLLLQYNKKFVHYNVLNEPQPQVDILGARNAETSDKNDFRFRLDAFSIKNGTIEDTLLIKYIENITGTNSLGDPTSNLVCSHLLWFNAPCETNPNLLNMGEELLKKLIFTPTYTHWWFKEWKASGFMIWDQPGISTMSAYLDQLFIQSIFLKTISIIKRMKTDGFLSKEKEEFIEDLMKRNSKTMSSFLKMKESLNSFEARTIPHTGTQHSFSLYEMLKTANILTNHLGISPLQLSSNLEVDNIIISELFKSYYEKLIQENPDLHQLLCGFKVIKSEYWCTGTSATEMYDSFQSVVNYSKDEQLRYLFDGILELSYLKVLENGDTSNYQRNNHASRIINSIATNTCTHISQVLDQTMPIPCPESSMMILTIPFNDASLQRLLVNSNSYRKSISKNLVGLLNLTPSDLFISGNRRYNELVRTIFEDYFVREKTDELNNLKDVNLIYHEAKGILLDKTVDRKLSRSQVYSAELLIKQVNAATVLAVKRIFKYTDINTKHLDNRGIKNLMNRILCQNGCRNMTIEERDQLLKWTKNQKMYVARKLTSILKLSLKDFNSVHGLKHISVQQLVYIFPHDEVLLSSSRDKIPPIQGRSDIPRIIRKNELEEDSLDLDSFVFSRSVDPTFVSVGMTRRNTALVTPNSLDSQQNSHSFTKGDNNTKALDTSTPPSFEEVASELYLRAISIYNQRKTQNNITNQQLQNFEEILSSSRNNIKEQLKNIISTEDALDVFPNDQYSFVILQKPLSGKQRQDLHIKIAKQHLKITKQLIILLQLTSEDFFIGRKISIPKKVVTYLFGSVDDRTNDYLHSVNMLYQVKIFPKLYWQLDCLAF